MNLDDEGVWSKAYLPATGITNNPGVYEGRVEFRHVQVQLISSNELRCWVAVLYPIGKRWKEVYLLD